MSDVKAIVRQEVEAIAGVARTWFEWLSEGDAFKKILVVEILNTTDPEERGFNESLLEEISSTAAHVLQNKTTMAVSGLKFVPAQNPRS